ncbi:MAG TPA: NAD(P)H-binding protein [Streptosporangiaceae bacterium]|nr:NAD(P)H-binding protein [Streptosporangiaceae bacterium]
MLLVSGATGNVGGELVRALAAAGQPVRALVRGPAPAGLPAAVQVAAGDLNQPGSLAGALRGVSGVFLLPGYADMPGLLEVIRQAGVERVVLLSGSSADGDTSNAVTAYMAASEAAVRGSGLPATILRPSGFMSNTLQWAPQLAAGDVVRAPFASVRVAAIDPRDIAAVAAIALTTADHQGQVYRITGPRAILPADRVRILAAVLGRELRFEAQPDDEARQEMEATMPREYVDAFFSFYVDGTLDDSVVLPAVERLTGRPPGTFEQWAQAHVSAFR